MKNIIVTILSVLSINAFAHFDASDIASYEFGISTGENGTYTVGYANLNEAGDINVYKQVSHVSEGKVGEPILVVSKTLNATNFERVRNYAIALSRAEITEDFFSVVCMIYVEPHANYDHLFTKRDYNHKDGVFLAPFRVIDGPSGCHVGYKVTPALEYNQQTAKKLKEFLMTLAYELMD